MPNYGNNVTTTNSSDKASLASTGSAASLDLDASLTAAIWSTVMGSPWPWLRQTAVLKAISGLSTSPWRQEMLSPVLLCQGRCSIRCARNARWCSAIITAGVSIIVPSRSVRPNRGGAGGGPRWSGKSGVGPASSIRVPPGGYTRRYQSTRCRPAQPFIATRRRRLRTEA
jgi:hypothetical protein